MADKCEVDEDAESDTPTGESENCTGGGDGWRGGGVDGDLRPFDVEAEAEDSREVFDEFFGENQRNTGKAGST